MIDLKSYAKHEDAAMDAAWLGANGIDAIVVDESGYGGNFLAATTPGTIRLQVLEDQCDAACEILAAKLPPPAPREEAPPSHDIASCDNEQTVFRVLLALDLVFLLQLWLFPDSLYLTPPAEVEAYFNRIIPSQFIWENMWDLYGGACLLSLLSYILLWFFIRAGRVLFIVSLFVWTVIAIFSPYGVLSLKGLTITAFGNLLGGAILAQMFLGTVALRFRTTLPPPPNLPDKVV